VEAPDRGVLDLQAVLDGSGVDRSYSENSRPCPTDRYVART
jgi:hypothetical protein